MSPGVDDAPVESVPHVLPIVLDQSLQRVQLISIMTILGQLSQELGVVEAEESFGVFLSQGWLQAK